METYSDQIQAVLEDFEATNVDVRESAMLVAQFLSSAAFTIRSSNSNHPRCSTRLLDRPGISETLH
jgi:hypothetical protein